MDFFPPAPLPDPEEPPPLPAVSDAEIGAARPYVEASRAAATRRAYDGDWRRFAKWCHDRGAPALPARDLRLAERLQIGAVKYVVPKMITQNLRPRRDRS